MHFLPKLLAGILAPMPITVWPTLANIVAATLAGSISGMVYFLVRKSAHAASLALALAMIPVAHSSLRMEAINSYANAYIPVAYLFSVVYLVRPIMGLINRLALCLITFVAVLTVPSVVLLIPLSMLVYRGYGVKLSKWIVSTISASLATLIQLAVIMQGSNERKTGISRSAIESWIARVPENLAATFLRDGSISNWLSEVSRLNTYRFATVVLLTVVAACLIALRSRELWRSSAALVIAGLTLSAMPSILFFPISRYFVWFQILVYAGGICCLTALVRSVPLRQVLLVLMILPMFGGLVAHDFRASAEYRWSDSIRLAVSQCEVRGRTSTPIFFAPGWPIGTAQDHLTERTKNEVRCADLR